LARSGTWNRNAEHVGRVRLKPVPLEVAEMEQAMLSEKVTNKKDGGK
jgi:hypothetical protein